MKKSIIDRIDYEISKLNEQDAEGYIWWNKFREIVCETPEPGEEQEIEFDLKKLTVTQDIYNFKEKK